MAWRADILPGYEQREIELPQFPPEAEEGDVLPVATLVRRNPPVQPRAVLSLNGWNDYFFQTHVADAWAALGYDFYALDLRRYGRSFRPGQLAGYVSHLSQHFEELDRAWEILHADHPSVVLSGHSTGGLVAALWAGLRPGRLDGLVLNAPWLAAQGSFVERALAVAVTRALGKREATRVLPIPDPGVYAESLHRSWHGEWDYDLSLKQNPSTPIRPGWLRAIVLGHDRVAEGLAIEVPVLMLMSARTQYHLSWSEEVMGVDVVLDVDRLARMAPKLGSHVTLVRLQGAMHDVMLSAKSVRERALDELRRWETAYLR